MEKNVKINHIELLESSLNDRPCKKHDDDHYAIWSSMKIVLKALEDITDKIEKCKEAMADKADSFEFILKKVGKLEEDLANSNNHTYQLAGAFQNLKANYPKISTMYKQSLITNGENVLDTVEIESGRYLLVKNITATDWNEYARLDKTFSWDIVEVTDGKYDITINLDSTEEGETATMTVGVDLLFVKF